MEKIITKNRTYFEVYGPAPESPAIILIMGYSGTIESWPKSFLKKLSENFNLYLVDIPGIGKGRFLDKDEDFTIKSAALELYDAINELNLNSYSLLGYSLGGTIALEVMRLSRSAINSSFIISSTAGGDRYTPPSKSVWDLVLNPSGENLEEISNCIWRACLSDQAMKAHEVELTEIFHRNKTQIPRRYVLNKHLLAYSNYVLSDSNFKFPIHIIHGIQDRLTPVENSRQLHEAIPGSILHEIDDCEHVPFLEKEGDVLSIIESQL